MVGTTNARRPEEARLVPEGVDTITAIVAAALGGAAVGVERQWSGHATGPGARFAGVRTFTLLGGFAGLTGWLWRSESPALAAILLGGGVALVVAGYLAARHRDTDATTETAALVVLAAGVAAGMGHLALASGVVAVTTLLLVEKSRLHAWVRRIDHVSLRAGARFAVMAVVILPMLPPGPYGPFDAVRPRALWVLVLLFSGLSFAGYVARRAVGPERGDAVAGLLGGFVSSTSVTLLFARASATRPAGGSALADGVIAAATVMYVRMLFATAILDPTLAAALVPYLAAPLVAGSAFVVTRLRGHAGAPHVEATAQPLAFGAALQMAALFQVVLLAVAAVRDRFGDQGLVVTGAVLGLTDVDALVLAMTRGTGVGTPAALGARAIAVGALANTVLKLVLAVALGRGTFRKRAALGLGIVAAASATILALLW